MNKEQIKAEMLKSISQEIDQWLEESQTIKSGYDYENRFLSYLSKVGKIMMKKSIGEVEKNRKKKEKC